MSVVRVFPGSQSSAIMLVLAIVLASPFAPSLAAQPLDPGSARQGPQPDTISVSGQAVSRVEPDLATLSFGLSAQAKTPTAARDSALATANAVVEALAALGVDKKDIRTGSFGLGPVYDDRPGKQSVIIGYRAEAEIGVRLSNLTLLAQAVETATKAGATEVRGLAYGRAEEGKLRADTLALAAAEALRKAEALAKALGRGLGRALRVDEGQGNFVAADSSAFMAKRAAPGPTEGAFSPGSLEYAASVSIVFALE